MSWKLGQWRKNGGYTVSWVHPLKLCATQYQLVNGKLQGKTTPTTPPNAFHTLESEPLTHFGWWPWCASPEWMSYLSRRCLCAWQRKTKLSFVQLFYCSPTDLLQPYWLFRVSGVKKRGNSEGGNQDVADLSQQSFFIPSASLVVAEVIFLWDIVWQVLWDALC